MKAFAAARLRDERFDPLFLSQLGEVCRTRGVFQLTDAQVLFGPGRTCPAEALEAMAALFSLPVDEKRRFQRLPGRTAMGWSNSELTKQRVDQKECWDIAWVPDPSRRLDHSSNVSPIDGCNRLPDGAVRNTLLNYYKTAKESVCDPLYRALCAAFDLSFDAVQAATHPMGESSKSVGFMRLNHYAKHAGDEGMNIHEHTDAGLFTVLWASDVRGLQYQDRQGGWERTVQADDGTLTLTINLGDMFQVLTNDAASAPVHRVVCERDWPLPRYSIALFFNPSETAVISPMTKQVSEGRERSLYRDIAWAKFRRRRFEGDAADLGVEVQISDWRL